MRLFTVTAQEEAAKTIKQHVDDNTARYSMSEDEALKTAEAIGVAAVRYFDLAHPSDYVFSFDTVLSFRGNTSVYLQYAISRLATLRTQAEQKNIQAGPVNISNTIERELALHIILFQEYVNRAVNELAPSVLCDYLLKVCCYRLCVLML